MHPYHGHVQFAEALSSDLLQLSRFVQFDERNFQTFSLENSRLLLAACTEIEALLKQLCIHAKPGFKGKDIEKYMLIADEYFPELLGAGGFVGSYQISLRPWIEWKSNKKKAPSWWRAHQSVKHNRHIKFTEASLENVLNAAAALETLLLVYFQRTYLWPHSDSLFEPISKRVIVAQI